MSGTARIRETFSSCKERGEAAFVGFVMDRFPAADSTVPNLLALQKGGADIIELAVPHSDPVADGPTIQAVANTALQNKSSVATTLEALREAREQGLKVPVVLFGYYNPFRAYGLEKLAAGCGKSGVDAVLIVDLPPEAANRVRRLLGSYGTGFIPLITPTTKPQRMASIAKDYDAPFIYAVALLGVTGARDALAKGLPEYLKRARDAMGENAPPVVVGFGISNRSMFLEVAKLADGVVVASAMLDRMRKEHEQKGDVAVVVEAMAHELTGRDEPNAPPSIPPISLDAPNAEAQKAEEEALGEDNGYFGEFGGSFVPEILRSALSELSDAWNTAKKDPKFWEEVRSFDCYVGRPVPLHPARRLKVEGGAKIWLKREDLAHTGAHKINNAIGQALLAKRLGKNRIIAETGAGQHGVAVATVCAHLDMECVVYMGIDDVRRQSLNVFRMRTLGAEVKAVESGSRTLKDAVNEAMRAWVTTVDTSHYLIGSAIGPHPFPTIVRDFQRVIGDETKRQFAEQNDGKLPDAVVACVGGGSNAIGLFHPFVEDKSVRLIGVEAAGAGMDTDSHCAPLSKGTPGVLHGTRTLLMQDTEGQISETHSISAGLDYPGVSPQHAHLKVSGRAEYVAASDEEALVAFDLLSKTEGIIPALESSHAISGALKVAATMKPEENIVILISGRGDKDMMTVAKHKGVELE